MRNEFSSIYSAPNSIVESEPGSNLIYRIKIILGVGALFSVWYFFQEIRHTYDIIQSGGPNFLDSSLEIVSKALFFLPKILVVYSFVLVLKGANHALKATIIAWMLAALHTVTFYLVRHIEVQDLYEVLRLVIHHIIPHTYFILTILLIAYEQKLSRLSM
jgi:hypothetical protein